MATIGNNATQVHRDPTHLLEYSDFNRPELYSRGSASRSKIPARLPAVTSDKAGTFYSPSGKLTLLRAIIAALPTEADQENIVALVASAVQICTNNNVNMLGLNATPRTVKVLTDAGDAINYERIVDAAATPPVDENRFVISSDIWVAQVDLEKLFDSGEHELYAYIGILMIAAVKEPTTENHTSFTTNRIRALQSRTDEKLIIFEGGTDWTSLGTLRRVHKAFNAYGNRRTHLVLATARLQSQRMEGPSGTFFMNFKLLEDYGFGQLTLIKLALAAGDWVRDEFPEMRAERLAWMGAVRSIMAAPETDRPFLKAAYGDQFVPAEPGSMNMLLGLSKEIMARFDPRWRRFGGGRLTDSQVGKVNQYLGEMSVHVDAIAETHA